MKLDLKRYLIPTSKLQQGGTKTTRQLAVNYSLCVQILNHSDDDDNEGDGEDLAAGADERGEDQWMARRPKHIAMYLLPPVFIS